MFKTSELQFKNKKTFNNMIILTFAHNNNEVSAIIKNNRITEIAYYNTTTNCDYIITSCPYGFKKLIAQYL